MQLALDLQTGEQVAIKFLERSGRSMKTKHILRCRPRSPSSASPTAGALAVARSSHLHSMYDSRFDMGLSHQGSRHLMSQQKRCHIGVSP